MQMRPRPSLDRSFAAARDTLEAFRRDSGQMASVDVFVDWVIETYETNGRLLTCGNGGSLCDAMHFAQEWTGRFRRERSSLPAMALSDSAALTGIANDFGYHEIFARQLEAHGRVGDLFVVFSTSGDSENVVRAVSAARRLGIRTVGLLGRGGGKVADLVDLAILVPLALTSDRIQEMHIKIAHAVIEAVEYHLFPELLDSD